MEKVRCNKNNLKYKNYKIKFINCKNKFRKTTTKII